MSEANNEVIVDFEAQLKAAEEATQRYEQEALQAKEQIAKMENERQLMEYAVNRSDQFDAALAGLNLTPYDRSKTLSLLQKGHCGVQLENDGGRCRVLIDGIESSMTEAVARFHNAEPNWFKNQPFQAEPSDPDLRIVARDEFRSEDHKRSYVRKFGHEKFRSLRSSSSEVYSGPLSGLSKERYLQLCPAEKVRVQQQLGLEQFELLMAGKRITGRRW